jgi:hypothetical protein
MLKGKFASSVFQCCKEKTPKMRKLVSSPQCVNMLTAALEACSSFGTTKSSGTNVCCSGLLVDVIKMHRLYKK